MQLTGRRGVTEPAPVITGFSQQPRALGGTGGPAGARDPPAEEGTAEGARESPIQSAASEAGLGCPGLGAVPEVIAGAEGPYSDAVGLAGHNQGFHRNFSEHGAALFRDTQEQVS